ncbi:MAG: hypothetical protein A2934_00970 [Candidatus Sungbacteria bacterium RIFCSPLOWO2_01_FULL_47_10]|uniref:Uncharacterized protein n=1 Tax=Candidatus Sungbacteria bacterium RIFCSPLOWO2_01_FULL_47_10 TaxID=1802276 RepID=A0A1G2L4K8_9BACT|nr:MAG: hypothetical protein A2934_00970 [Candidatus Sungbacteria bacterium RIFCSPLOWO2_01_FULL_47_10]
MKLKHEQYIGGREGVDFEWDIFGSADIKNPEYQKELASMTKPNGFVFFEQAKKLVKKFQSSDPRIPERPFARELRMEIIERLGFVEEKDMDRVKFYSAIGTPLDIWHGIDAFIEVEQEHGAPIVITLDATMLTKEEKRARGQEIKADVLVSKKDVHIEDEDELQSHIEKNADSVYEAYVKKREEAKNTKHQKTQA